MPTTIRHILVAHDFGETANAGLAYALDLAEKLSARVTVVHAYEIPVYGLPYAHNVATATAMALYEFCRQYPEG